MDAMYAEESAVPTTPRLAPKRLAIAAAIAGALLFGMVLMSLWQRQQTAQQPPPPPLPPIYEVQGDSDGMQRLNLPTSWAGVDRTPPPPPKPPTPPAAPPPPPMFPAQQQTASLAPITPVPPLAQPAPALPAMTTAQPGPSAAPAQPPGTGATPPTSKLKRSWDFQVKGKRDDRREGQERAERTGEGGKQGEGEELIHRARWAIPANPLKTIYRSQTLTGRLLHAMHSDLPGQVKIELTTPVLDRFGYDTEIVPKGAILIVTQQGRPSYGQTRLPVGLEQLEFPSGEVVNFKAAVGSEDGANGLTGSVNNHYVKLGAATLFSAILNIGVRSLAGTPGRGQHYQDPGQQAAQDIGQSVQRDAQSIVDRELRVPPTITIPAGTFCTINLAENIQFHAPAPVVR
jgi:type IV secretion system protein VirB10